MQAWKKTSAHLRSHSWYADTLGLDFEALRLPEFLKQIKRRLEKLEDFEPRLISIVPAPKDQKWAYNGRDWEPKEQYIEKKLRPLAHVDLQDQVIATAIMLCLADRVETRLGNPTLPIESKENRKKSVAYGHRLFCDVQNDGQLRHRWGSSKLYRGFFKDYQVFLERPKVVAKELRDSIIAGANVRDVVIVQSDLSKFYDRVRPASLHSKLRLLQTSEVEDEFFRLAERLFDWRWEDEKRAERYALSHSIPQFAEIALPQGLVASGFFANIALLEFDAELKKRIGTLFDSQLGLVLHDACYYVDDFRIVLTSARDSVRLNEEDVGKRVVAILQDMISQTIAGLEVSKDKTQVTIEGRDKRFLVRQSREAARIQSQVSGTFDMLHGTELIAAIEGFFHTQQRYSTSDGSVSESLLVGVPDMADGTAARFAAGKFRRTFRSLRPLLADGAESKPDTDESTEDEVEITLGGIALSKTQLDERGKFFAALLIEEWIRNPGSIRLLRIALDIYPDREFLDEILPLLQPGWKSPKYRKAKREVRLYCLAELFRAGATETGIVPFNELECLPSNVSVEEYHQRLIREAHEIFEAYLSSAGSSSRFPWYLMQQVFLYLAARNQVPEAALDYSARGGVKMRHYWMLLKFLGGEIPANLSDRAILLAEVNTALGHKSFGYLSAMRRISSEFLLRIRAISPRLMKQIWDEFGPLSNSLTQHAAARAGILKNKVGKPRRNLEDVASQEVNPFFEEENLLQLASFLLDQPPERFEKAVAPWSIACELIGSVPQGFEFGKIRDEFSIEPGNSSAQFFESPEWCDNLQDRQRFNIGLLLRYALRGSVDFLESVSFRHEDRGPRYARPSTHWEQQRYSGYQGRDSFGPPWMPISSFTENLLFELLRWPGSGILAPIASISQLLKNVKDRLYVIRKMRGRFTSSTFLEQSAPWPSRILNQEAERPLRVGIVQSIIPGYDDYAANISDPQLNGVTIRTSRRAHLATVMDGVSQMLRIRGTHRNISRTDNRNIDLLIFPELAIHPDDINLLILPFVRQHRCIALFGQVYHPMVPFTASPLINSAMWLVPEWNDSRGLQIRRIEQGKKHLTADEQGFSPAPMGFRPVQWLIDYQWHANAENHRPLRLSASICYDATDIAMAADLKSRSDLYIICALNKDVGTFDRMSEALHYHMFQGVIVVNNGQFGGSSFFMPFGSAYRRQIFHLHGQPQTSIAFAEIHPRKLVERPTQSLTDQIVSVPNVDLFPHGKWKEPPANWNNPGS